MSWKDRVLGFVRKYGTSAKTVAVSVLNVAAPGSAALVGLVESACDKAVAVAHDHWEDEVLQLANNNAGELDRLGKLMELLQGDLARVCDKAFAFADQLDEVEEIVRKALCADPALSKALRQLDDLTSQFQCVVEQNNRLLEGQDEMRPILQRLNRVADFFDEMIANGFRARDLAHAMKNWQDVSQKIQKRDTAGVSSIVQQMRTSAPTAASVCLLEAGAAMAERDYPGVSRALGTAIRLKPDDNELVELQRRATRIATSATPRQPKPTPSASPGPRRLQPNDALDGMPLEKRLGAGGWGQVFKSGSKAIKVLHPEFSTDRVFMKRFREEIGILARLPRHPNLVKLDDFNYSREHECWYLVMEYIDGPTFEEVLSTEGPLDEKGLRMVFEPLTEALAKAHEAGIVHRDIKPGNMIFRHVDQRLVLVDFGLAVNAEDVGHTKIGGVTVYFAAPEQLRGEKATACSDVYSLAATMNFGLCYDRPHLRIPHRFDADQVPRNLRNVLSKGMKENPSLRYSSAIEFLTDLIKTRAPEEVQQVSELKPAGGVNFQGETIRSVRELATLLRDRAKDAVNWLEDGSVARCFAELGSSFPIKGSIAPGLAGLQQLFEVLGLTNAPEVSLDKQEIHLVCRRGEQVTESIFLRTGARKWIYGFLSWSGPWLSLPSEMVSGAREAEIPITVDSSLMDASRFQGTVIQITVNGGKTLEVRVLVEVKDLDEIEAVPEAPMEMLTEAPIEDMLPEVPVEDVLPEVPVEDVLPEPPVEEVLPEVPIESVFSCPFCGHHNENGSMYCEICMSSLSVPIPPAPEMPPEPVEEMSPEDQFEEAPPEEVLPAEPVEEFVPEDRFEEVLLCPFCAHANETGSLFCEMCKSDLTALPIKRELTIDEVIAEFVAAGGRPGRTATPGHQYYESASKLMFIRCQCGWDDTTYGWHEYIARSARGKFHYVGHNLHTGVISCGPKGFHYCRPEVPECIS